MAKNALKMSMVGEMFEIYLSQMVKNTLKLSTIDNFRFLFLYYNSSYT